jgi:hypothetical protein
MSFEMLRDEKEGKVLLKFVGGIDEDAVFPSFNDFSSEVFIDLNGVSAINSVGIRSWIRWFAEYSSNQFHFINCPKALVMQINMVEGFLPDGASVLSMQVPFYCEDCDEEKDVMLTVGKEIVVSGDQVNLNLDLRQVCGEGCQPELDVNEAKYFRFLVHKTQQNAA